MSVLPQVSVPTTVESLSQRALVFEHITDAVLFVGVDGLVADCNPAAVGLFGWPRGQLIGAPFTQVFAAPDAEQFRAGLQAADGGAGSWQGELRFVSKLGCSGRLAARVVALEGGAGYLTILRELSGSEWLAAKPADDGSLLRAVIDAVPEPIFCKDREGRFLFHNKADQAVVGTATDESFGKTVFDYPEMKEHAAIYHADDMRVVETGEPVVNREEPFMRADGSKGWFLTSKYPLRNPAGETIGLIGIAHDVTNRIEAQQKIAADGQLLRMLIDAIPDPIFFKDCEGRHLLVNDADRSFFGIDRGQGLGRTVFEWPIPPEIAARYAADDRQVIESGEPLVNREEEFHRPDGYCGWFLTSKYPLRDADGQIYGLVGICRDITALKSATEELQRARQRLEDHASNSPLAVIEWSADFRVVRWTGRSEVLFGWSAAEATGKSFGQLELVYPEDEARVAEVTQRLSDGRDLHNISVNRNRTREGKVIYCEWHNSVLRDADGRLVSILSMVQDISEQKLAEQTILENERLYHAIIETTNTGYYLGDERGCLLDANNELLRMLGYPSLEAALNGPFTDWIAPHDMERAQTEFERLLRDGVTVNFELDLLTRSGEIVPAEANARVRRGPSGLRVIAFLRNISNRRAAEAERQSFERKLLETQKLESLGVLAGGIAHDFNNLLTGVLGNASLARLDAGEDSELQPYLEQIEVAASRAADLCRQMLAYSGKGSFVVSRLDLNTVVEDTAKLLQISISKKAVLSYQLAPKLPAVMGDITQIRQVIMNLVLNAAEAVGERSGHIWVTTSVVAGDLKLSLESPSPTRLGTGDFACFEVRDNGAGMTPEVRARIFDPFFTTKFTGRGLGLAAVQGIVRGHKGRLQVQSELGKGTVFRVYLPCVAGQPDAKVNEAPVNPAWRGSGKVLVIDDEATVRVTTSHMLEALGFAAEVAVDGREGIEKFRAAVGQWTVVLLDLTMPHVDGDEVLREIRRLDPNALVLLMSGFDEAEVLKRCDGLAATGFLHKPFLLASLQQRLQQVLGVTQSGGI